MATKQKPKKRKSSGSKSKPYTVALNGGSLYNMTYLQRMKFSTLALGKTVSLEMPNLKEFHKLLLDVDSSPILETGDYAKLWNAMSGSLLKFVGYDSLIDGFIPTPIYPMHEEELFNFLYKSGCLARWSVKVTFNLYEVDSERENEELVLMQNYTMDQVQEHMTATNRSFGTLVEEFVLNNPTPLWLSQITGEDSCNLNLTSLTDEGFFDTKTCTDNPKTLLEKALSVMFDSLEGEYEGFNVASFKFEATMLGV